MHRIMFSKPIASDWSEPCLPLVARLSLQAWRFLHTSAEAYRVTSEARSLGTGWSSGWCGPTTVSCHQ